MCGHGWAEFSNPIFFFCRRRYSRISTVGNTSGNVVVLRFLLIVPKFEGMVPSFGAGQVYMGVCVPIPCTIHCLANSLNYCQPACSLLMLKYKINVV